jgi:hypothetical protein
MQVLDTAAAAVRAQHPWSSKDSARFRVMATFAIRSRYKSFRVDQATRRYS